jgi:hypothetical protein
MVGAAKGTGWRRGDADFFSFYSKNPKENLINPCDYGVDVEKLDAKCHFVSFSDTQITFG